MKHRSILLIETSTSVCSVALAVNGEVKAFKELDERNIHAGNVTLYIEDVMAESGLEFGLLDAVAVSRGPGSYTGLRIGVSVAKGLCFALDKPLIAVGTLDSLLRGILKNQEFDAGSVLVPMIDARRMEVYSAVYTPEMDLLEPIDARIIDDHSFDHYAEKEIVLFGDGAAKFKDLFAHNPRVKFPVIHSSARYMADIADQKYLASDFENLAYFEPFYLKEFVANKPKKA